ncbi:uncharacterized protein LOC125683174 [Ostrea edulis]|uniref:uncharacterized protein LOC125683174 n=1 Tax=Ostrea edulis TaxID=37623 RepID=UPI0020946D5D|nr:uncharacterized protein LOC125683174 [Ostrea edulis]
MPPKKRRGATVNSKTKSRKTHGTGAKTRNGGEMARSTKTKAAGQNLTPIMVDLHDEPPVVTSFPPKPFPQGIGAVCEAQAGQGQQDWSKNTLRLWDNIKEYQVNKIENRQKQPD